MHSFATRCWSTTYCDTTPQRRPALARHRGPAAHCRTTQHSQILLSQDIRFGQSKMSNYINPSLAHTMTWCDRHSSLSSVAIRIFWDCAFMIHGRRFRPKDPAFEWLQPKSKMQHKSILGQEADRDALAFFFIINSYIPRRGLSFISQHVPIRERLDCRIGSDHSAPKK